jgi:Enoyl-(Acyl carrier protein) reductase
VNPVALGSIATERYQAFLPGQQPAAAAWAQDQMRALHPLGRAGRPAEVVAAVGYLLSEDATFVNGAILPVDGGRSVLGLDPEEARTCVATEHVARLPSNHVKHAATAAPNAGSPALTDCQHARGHSARRRLFARVREDAGFSVTAFPSASVRSWKSSRLPTEHLSTAEGFAPYPRRSTLSAADEEV